jgi:type VI secretion system protein ImpF
MPPRNSSTDVTVTLSVLDRLIDREPNLAADAYTTRAQSIRQLKAAVRRDMEWLLNTRRNPEPANEDMEELAKSLYNYGLPDFSHVSIHNPRDRGSLTLEIENTVARYEPRLKDIRVEVLEYPVPGSPSRILHFQIEGMLQMDPSPEQISFDTVLQLASGEYQIRGGDRGA